MNVRHFLVDVEATGQSPAQSVMTEFGVVDFLSRSWFHGHIWDFEPTPGIPALPIATSKNPGITAVHSDMDSEKRAQWGFDGTRQNVHNSKRVFDLLKIWLYGFDGQRKVFVSDNPGWDFMWMAYGFDSSLLTNPFGHSSRRIGDFAAGLAGDWKKQNGWKSLRETRHTHNPVDDAMGNAEALAKLLGGIS